MKKIIKLSEQEFKNIIENVISEQKDYDPRDDPKALALVNFLNDSEQDEDYGLFDIKLNKSSDHNYGLNLYNVGEREYMVGTDEEADVEYTDYMNNLIEEIGISSFNQDFIMNYVESGWFKDWIKEHYEFYIEDIKLEESSDPKQWKNRLEEEMVENNSENEEEFLEKIIDNAGDPVEYFKDMFGKQEFFNIIKDNNLIDWDIVIEDTKKQDGRGKLSSYDGKENYFNDYYIYRVN